ncbi:MAG: hypothetical protein R3D62_03175 [Xanthobacteraceae bacterium]
MAPTLDVNRVLIHEAVGASALEILTTPIIMKKNEIVAMNCGRRYIAFRNVSETAQKLRRLPQCWPTRLLAGVMFIIR